ncbi:MAG TPA: hypothetical protein VGR96_15310 [Acidobacteriaceae bacterium]|nr:hypothetical protein [Acidobacteriaceae bacterium]
MQSIAQNESRRSGLAKIAETEEEIASLRQHLKEVIEGAAFKGSHRSGQFLQYIVEQAMAGHFESLKERVIGVELFGRLPSYDTGEDAIVRVTASDVRKRLLQHYGRYGNSCEVRISLPLGSYIPEVARDPRNTVGHAEPIAATPDLVTIPQVPTPLVQPAAAEALKPRPQLQTKWIILCVLLVGLNLAGWVIFGFHSRAAAAAPPSVLPWKVFFRSSRPIQLVASDPNIEEIQRLTGTSISISDYANRQYLSNTASLSPEIAAFCKNILRGDKTAAVDARVIAAIAQLGQSSANKINVQVARYFRLSDLYTDDNFILLGSPRSNPWASLYNDQLDFRFALDGQTGQEIIRNAHPRAGELAEYIPTAGGFATGQSFATVSFLRNPGENGHVLLLGGANAEGTEAAGELVTNPQRLSSALQQCGVASHSPIEAFQLLLRLNTMAGSPSNVDVLTCHILPENPSK